MTPYLLIVYGDVDPVIRGPFKSEKNRDVRAIKHRKKYGDEDGLYMLDIIKGKPRVFAYRGGFLDDIPRNERLD